jgi:AcrR family transcriptional regulator
MLRLAETALLRTIEDIGIGESSSKLRLIAVGEQTLGNHGFEGVALHKIAHAAGQGNKYAVQYHFKSLEGLIAAIFAVRHPWIDDRREALLKIADERDRMGDLHAILETIFLPVAEQVGQDGYHSYARFLLQYKSRPQRALDSATIIAARPGPTEASCRVLGDLIGKNLVETEWRLRILEGILLTALVERDNAISLKRQPPTLEETLNGAIDVMVAALGAISWPPLP